MTATLDHSSTGEPVSEEPERKRVLILERDAAAFARLAAPIEANPRLELVTANSETSSLLDLVALVRPHVALVDTRIDDGGSAELVQQLHDAASGIQCIALSNGDDDGELTDMFAAGVAGWMDKSAAAGTIIDAVDNVVGRKPDPPHGFHVAPRRQGEDGQRLTEVREVIRTRGFRMIFQPIVELETGRVIGMEALARFLAGPFLPPDAWLRHAEEVGLRHELEVELLRDALEHQRLLPPQAFMTVNLSPGAGILAARAAAFPEGLLHRLVVEITDHRRVEDYGPLAEALAGLRAGGLRIAVDDSGQGLSSLHRVTQLRPDFIKLNRALTRDIDRDATRRILAVALTSVAAQAKAEVIAEGIETSSERETLRSLGISYGQGYLIARPEPLLDASTPSITLPARQADATVPDVPPPEDPPGGFRDAVRAAFAAIERELPDSRCFVSHLDYQQRRFRLISCSAALDAPFEPGFGTPLEESLCFYMVSGRGSRLCGNAATDPVYGSLPLQQALEVVSYAAVPLELPAGQQPGTLAVISGATDRYHEKTLGLLQEIGRTLGSALEREVADAGSRSPGRHLRMLAATDSETGILNRPSFLEHLRAETDSRRRRRPTTYLVHLTVDECPDGATTALLVAEALDTLAQRPDVVGRLDERTFAALLRRGRSPGAATDYPRQVTSRLAQALAERGMGPTVRAGVIPVTDHSAAAALRIARAAATPLC